VADHRNLRNLSLALLIVAGLRHYGWLQFPDDMRGMASKGLGGVEVLALLWLAWSLIPSHLVRTVLALWAVHEALIVACSGWWLLDPWVAPPGQPICSVRLGMDLGAYGILAVLVTAIWITTKKKAG
jgi:hypothetical protein